MSKKIGEMTVSGLQDISKIFLDSDNVSEHKLNRFRLDIYFAWTIYNGLKANINMKKPQEL